MYINKLHKSWEWAPRTLGGRSQSLTKLVYLYDALQINFCLLY